MKRVFILMVFFIYCVYVKAQNVEIPKMAMPNKHNQVLIDSLLKITNFETYFKNYCYKEIEYVGSVKHWSSEQIDTVKKQVNYNDFKGTVIYN